MKKVLFVLVAVLAVSCTQSYHFNGALEQVSPESMGMDSKRLAQADSVIEQAIRDTICPGAVFAVVRDDKLVYLKAYGNKQLIPEVVPMTTETIFDLASLSKCVGTTLSIMQLVERGFINLTDPVSRYIPEFAPWVDPATGEKVQITIQDLMTHTSGLSAYTNVASCVARFGENQPDSLMHHIAVEIPRNFRPGTDYIYSCLNFVTLQNVLQNITGQRLCDYAYANVYEPLGLKHTCYFPTDEPVPEDILANIAPTELQSDGLPYLGQVHDPIANRLNAGNSGNAGVFSTAEDLAVIAAALLNGGAIDGRRILSPAAVQMMATIPEDIDHSIGRSFGWDANTGLDNTRGNLTTADGCIYHTGYTGTSMVIDFGTKTAIILLTNRVHPYDTGSLFRTRAMVANIVASSIVE